MNDEYQAYEDTDGSGQGMERWLARIRRRSLGDVRIHDSAQAGDLARRLGARAFTVGRHIYVRPDLASPATPEGDALLAHELWHVAEQSGATEMPLLRPSAPSLAWQVAAWDASNAAPQHAEAGMSVQRDIGAPGSSSSEASAETVERAALQAAQGGRRGAAAQGPDPVEVAERVYALIAMELMLDNERGAHGW